MINLLPRDQKKQLRAAHANVAFVKYLIVILVSAAFLMAACTMTLVFLQNNNVVKNGDNPLDFSSSQVTQQGKILHTNLLNAGKLLNQQIKYSKVMVQLSKILPDDSVINSISSDQNDAGKTKMTLQIIAGPDIDDGQIQSLFQKSTMFSDYRLISEDKNKSGVANYPNIINFEMTINREVAL